MKSYLNIALIVLTIFINACTVVQTEDGFVPPPSVPVVKDVIVQEKIDVSSTEEEKKYEQEKIEELINNIAGIAPHKELSNRVKTVEIKKVVVKPVYSTSNELFLLTQEGVDSFLENIEYEDDLIEGKKYKDKSIISMMDHYKVILQTSASCCIANITEQLKSQGVSSQTLITFLANDANDYGMQNTCLIVSNNDITDVFGKGAISRIIKKVRKDCICNNKESLRKTVNNFYKIYNTDPEFYKETLIYKYKDKQGRVVEHDINETVLNIAITLENCI